MRLTRPLFKYFGSKWRLAGRYPAPVSDHIVEPFAGGAGYSLRHHEHQVTLVELNPRIAGLWEWLISAPSDVIARLPSFRGERGLDLAQWAAAEGLPWQAAELVIRWQRSGTNDCTTVSDWNCKPGMWGERTRDYVAEAVQHIRHWRVIHGDYSLLRPCRATLFCDPPYQSQHPQVYRNDSPVNYEALTWWLLDVAWEQIIVCEAEGATWLPFEFLAEIKTGRTGHNGAGKAREVVFIR